MKELVREPRSGHAANNHLIGALRDCMICMSGGVQLLDRTIVIVIEMVVDVMMAVTADT